MHPDNTPFPGPPGVNTPVRLGVRLRDIDGLDLIDNRLTLAARTQGVVSGVQGISGCEDMIALDAAIGRTLIGR